MLEHLEAVDFSIKQHEKTVKRSVTKLLLGLLVSIGIFALLFYFFLFANPLGIHETNQLKWIPLLIVAIGTYSAGVINKSTSIKWLALLLLPLLLLKPFNYLYFPFILAPICMAVFMLIVSRQSMKNKRFAWAASAILFGFFLSNQPLIIQKKGFGYDKYGEMMNASTIWDVKSKKDTPLPDHILSNVNGDKLNLKSLTGKKYFITFWATWCAPCLAEKPDLEKLKTNLEDNKEIEFIDISFDENENTWRHFLADNACQGIQLMSGNSQLTSRKLDFAGIPMHILVDEEGNFKKYRTFESAKFAFEKMK